jgi:hypothetical protein
MRSHLVEVTDVLGQNSRHLAYAQHQHVIRALAPNVSDETFTDGIGEWCPLWRVDHLNARSLGYPCKLGSVHLVIVTDQVLRLLLERRRLPQLLRDPLVRRMFGCSNVYYPPAFLVHNHKRMNGVEEYRHYRHEITRPDVLPIRL